jgi:hypothetical protein
MNKSTPQPDNNIWDDSVELPAAVEPAKKSPAKTKLEKPVPVEKAVMFDLEGLMTDFPTATELERFVFDQTDVILNLKGRANKLKYQVAMDVLNGEPVDPAFIGAGNPYLEKADLVPEEPMKTLPPRDAEIPALTEVQNQFFTAFVPHSDPDYHAQGRKMHVTFRKYKTGMITYDVHGPIEPRPYGEKIDKFGRIRPEIIKWVDPRTGEQIVQREDGSFTPVGRRLKAMMQTMKYNDTNQWLRYIDRDFISLNQRAAANPWDLSEG